MMFQDIQPEQNTPVITAITDAARMDFQSIYYFWICNAAHQSTQQLIV